MLKSIELIGFKSFAKRGKLDFTAPVTAIVGPNGSGKSNTAEAFRFVLGEQGGKVLRVRKGTDLIWGGSRSIPKASRAGVRLVLDNSAGNLNIGYDEVVLERSVLSDGTHEYYINGSRVRLKDIQDLLSGANIGSSGHHIISQGQADRILVATPKERREMLEDALGLKGYTLRKQEAERKLATTEENLSKALATQRELLLRLKYLERQVAAIEQAKALAVELEHKYAAYVYAESSSVESDLARWEREIQAPRSQLKEVDKRINTLKAKLEEAKQKEQDDTKDFGNKLVTELEHEIAGTQDALELAKQEHGKVLGQIELLGKMQNSTKTKPEVVPREAVRVILSRVMNSLDEASKTHNIEKIKELILATKEHASKFIANVLDGGQDKTQKRDNKQDEELMALQQRSQALQRQIADLRDTLNSLKNKLTTEQAKETDKKQETATTERDLYKELALRNEILNTLSLAESHLTAAKQRQSRLSEDTLEVEALLGKHINSVKVDGETPSRREIERLKLQVEANSNLDYGVLREYDEVKDEYEYLSSQTHDLKDAVAKLTDIMATIDKQAKESFQTGLAKMNAQFEEFFSLLFGGGGAKLEEELEVGAESKPGIRVSVQLPRKRVTTLETLSGGERALASIALIFAMSQVNPPPFIILDETDAALDEANSRRYAEVVRKLSTKSQLILITHNRATMAVADTLYGVTMGGDGVSQLLSVQLKDAEQYAK